MRSFVRIAAVAGLSAGLGVLGLSACSKAVKAPFDAGVCFAMEPGKDGAPPTFNKVAEDQPQIEFCAARLEEMRVRFLSLGGSRQEIIGSYQGRFLFIDSRGVWSSQTLEGSRFFMLARTGDGRLAVPGAFEQPGPAPVAPPEPAPAP